MLIHGRISKFDRGGWQRCPLDPYLYFLLFIFIIGEVLTHVIKKVGTEGRLQGVVYMGVKSSKAYLIVQMTHPSYSQRIRSTLMNLLES